MTQKECDFLVEISSLAIKCPAPSPNPYDLRGFIHASRDYEKILTLACAAIQYYAFYSSLKTKKGDEVDEEYVEYCKEISEKNLKELKNFVNKRVKEGWA